MDYTKNLTEGLQLSDEFIGQGAYGVVRMGYINGTNCAVKITHQVLVKASKCKGCVCELILHEADVMKKLPRHFNVIQFIGLYYPPSNEGKPLDHPPYLVTELCHK